MFVQIGDTWLNPDQISHWYADIRGGVYLKLANGEYLTLENVSGGDIATILRACGIRVVGVSDASR